jgi:CubicO group peptidase (beta-lactamase class C family)
VNQEARNNWPTYTWESIRPQEAGMSLTALDQLHSHASNQEHLRSLLIVRSGRLVFEEYYNGWHAQRYQNLMSCTKCVVTMLIGIMLHEGLLQGVDQPLLAFFPEYRPQYLDARKQEITLQHLLTMSSGYDEPNASGRAHSIIVYLEESASLLNVLDRPMQQEPGMVYSYDNLSAYLLGHVLQRQTGMSLARFAYTYLFQPLGIWQDEQGRPFPWKSSPQLIDQPHPFGLWNQSHDFLWSVDRQGDEIAAFGLQMTPREMAKLGYLYLNQGVWDTQRLLSSAYVQDCLRPHIDHTPIGYANWRLGNRGGYEVPYGYGHGDQTIALVPSLDLVVVMTAAPDGTDQETMLDLALLAANGSASV